MLDCF